MSDPVGEADPSATEPLPASTVPTPTAPVASEPVRPAPPSRPLVPPEDRGTLELAPVVVERIAQAAAGEIDGVLSGPRRWTLGRSDQVVRASAEVDGLIARLRIRVPLRYPIDARAVVTQVRHNVVARLAEYADVTVRTCDVDVTALVAAARTGRTD